MQSRIVVFPLLYGKTFRFNIKDLSIYNYLCFHFLLFIRFSMNIYHSLEWSHPKKNAWWAQVDSNHRHIIAYALGRRDLFRLAPHRRLVGSSGLEPPTSRLSGGRSNRLSYKPILVWLNSLSLRVLLDVAIHGGDKRDRTADPLLAKQVLSQLSYTPISS